MLRRNYVETLIKKYRVKYFLNVPSKYFSHNPSWEELWYVHGSVADMRASRCATLKQAKKSIRVNNI